MKKSFKVLSSLLLAVLMVFSLSAAVFAASPTITFKGMAEGFGFAPGSEYTATDLFDNFKNVMPGDRLTQDIVLKNEATDCDYIKVYMRAVVHDEEGNPLTYSEPFENADGKDQTDVDGVRDETVATMRDFLSKLTMRIYNGTDLIYNASPDQTGALADNVFLGDLLPGKQLELKVELDVPADLGSEYANRVGEVDWVFLVEAIELEKLTVVKVWKDNGDPSRPKNVNVNLLKDGEISQTAELNADNQWTYTWDELDDRYSWTVEEVTPKGYQVSYTTKDNTVFITNSNNYTPGPYVPKYTDLTVKKVWNDGESKNVTRPDSVTVTLYNGSTAVEKVTLSEKNNWSYTWKDLNGYNYYSVVETGVPKGYTPTYRANGGTITITNTAHLIQTGQLSWPIPVLGSLGALMIVFGVLMTRKKKKRGNV